LLPQNQEPSHFFPGQSEPWLVELIGPQHSGKSTIASLLSFTLESNGIPTAWVETDTYVFNLFPQYRKLYHSGEREKASKLLDERWSFFEDVIESIITKGISGGYAVMHDHVSTSSFRSGVDKAAAESAGGRHIGVMITAPLDTLLERWETAGVREEKVRKMQGGYGKFERIRKENLCDLVIDTTLTSPEKAVASILNLTYPDIRVDLEKMETQRRKKIGRKEPLTIVTGMPKLNPGLQLYREGRGYMVVFKHDSYITDDIGNKIIRLCDGTNSVEEIVKKSRLDSQLVQAVIKNMLKNDMISLLSNNRRQTMARIG
jgi:adenylylsulfate kinase-like enzyme